MTNGIVDNYLTAEEEAYLKSGGSDDTAEKLESLTDESTESREDTSTDDSRAESESSNALNESDSTEDERAETASDTDNESDDIDAQNADDEKSSKRDYEKAFKVERHKRKELKEALEANAKKTAEMEAILQKLQQAMNTTQSPAPYVAPAEDIPDPEVDPLGFQQYQIKQLEKQIGQHNKYLNEKHEYEQRAISQNAFMETYKQSAQQFAQKAPDFKNAYQYLTKARLEEHQAAGYTVEQANALLIEEEMAIVAKAYQDKVNPAERIYNLAKYRGFDGIETKKDSAPKKLSDIKKGMDNSKSLKSGGGADPQKDLGMDDIDNMNFQEFDEFWAGYKAKSKGQG